ncbi:response regulator transcription factor [Pseudalkalibacillus berkeleyi]|uniref:Response regulator transcription factor n=1 Tax=Pseudalkalibacillus berkeleyi TaxID=1069813 RepID=A0ABS9GU69_9BACL|nr:response regulator transcription factor [Pseudalkalibacillus berkeleyi]MCF6136384.1 response regulator transcription factor [Pseudalkalibacillus berkeleyi]
MKILVVDDEKNILDVSKRYLEREGYTVETAINGKEALHKWKSEQPDLIVLDLMMPEKDGWKVCEEIRLEDDVPIIMLTARGEEMDRILGLTIGADDYMTKPFSPKELVLRIKSIFHRMRIGESRVTQEQSEKLTYGKLEIDPVTRLVHVGQNEMKLTVKEFELLWLLASHPNQAFSRTQLLNKIWDIDFYGDTTTVTVHIRRIREKIEPNPSEPFYIQTVWGIGYKFEGTEKR